MIRPNFKSLTTRLILLGLVFVVVGAMGRTYFLSNLLRQNISESTSAQLQTLATYVGKDIDHGIVMRRDFLTAMAAQMPVAVWKQPQALQVWLNQRQVLNPVFSQGLMVVNLQGVAVGAYQAQSASLGKSFADRDYFQTAVRGEFAMGCPVRGRLSNQPILPMAAPLRDGAGRVQAVLVGVSKLHSADFLEALSTTRVGQTGGLVLVSPRCKLFVGASDHDIALKPTPAEGKHLQHDRAMNGFRGVGIDVRGGIEELAAIASVPSTDWFVVARMPTQEVFEPVVRLRAFIRNNTLVLVVFFVFSLIFVLRYQLRPLTRAAKHADSMVSGAIPMEPLPVVRDDEVGMLTTAFNRVLAKLLASHAEMDHMAHHDSLTGLPNRQLLADRMQQAFARAQRQGTQVAVLFLDLDGFKPVNDDLGHEAGDAALREVARRLEAVVRRDDTVARVGGDEFVILLPDLKDKPRETAELVAEKCMEVFKTPFHIHGHSSQLGTSIGIAMGVGDGTPDKLLIAADKAMYEAKGAGRGRFVWAAE